MYASIRLPWSAHPSAAETAYRHVGLVRTHGSIFLLPPDQSTLIAAFNMPPRPKTRMSSGAVALCKHFERGDASSEHGRAHPFWPLPVGSNENKSKMAAEVLEKMLSDAQWRNVMMLHRGVAVYEVRNGRGYGMRWTLELDLLEEEGEGARVQETLPLPLTAKSDGEGGDGEVLVGDADDDDEAVKHWTVRRILFRGFLEPIVGLDHELVEGQLAPDPVVSD